MFNGFLLVTAFQGGLCLDHAVQTAAPCILNGDRALD